MNLFMKKPIDPTAKKIAELRALDEAEAGLEARALAALDHAVRGLDAFEDLNASKLRRRGFRDDLAALGHPLPPPLPTGLSQAALDIAARVLIPIAVESNLPITPRTLMTFR
jgi:hypothetical protein